MSNTSQGSLTVVGTGIEVVSHLTTQAEHLIAHAEKVLYVVPGAWADEWMTGLNPNAESLSHLYGDDISRLETYRQMTETIMAHVRQGLRVCAVFYGHPAVFVTPSHEVIRLARAEGFEAKMCPGISAEDCLFADLGFDPGRAGCQSFEATDFLVRHRRFDPWSGLVIWQVGLIGHLGPTATKESRGLKMLVDVLSAEYPLDHEITLYEAAPHPHYVPRIEKMSLRDLPDARMMTITTLYVPPKGEKPIDRMRLTQLGLTETDITKTWGQLT